MKWFSALNIRNKLIVIIMAVSLTVVSMVGAVRIAWDIQQSHQTLEQQLSTLSQLIGGRSSAALAFDNEALAEENLSSLSAISHITLSCLYQNDGRLLAGFSREKNLTGNACPDFEKIRGFKQELTDERLNMLTNIKQGDVSEGWLYISSDLSVIYHLLKAQIVFTLVALAFAILLTIFLAGRVQRFISDPISEITNTAREIEKKGSRDVRVNVSREDEIGELADTFNSMLDALDTKNKQLHRSQKMDALGKLTGGIAHDYNNMLGVIIGYSELLSGRLKGQEKLSMYADEIHRAGERGAKLTKKLLGFSKRNSSQAEVVNINTVLADEQHMLEKTLTASINLEYILEENLWSTCIDLDDIENAILNMSINAMHAIDGTGKLKIKTSNVSLAKIEAEAVQLTEGEYVVLDIQDNGCGMDLSTQDKIFDPFYSTKGSDGTGLGLSQVYGFVNSSGGGIKVYSELGSGTRFLLYFPRCREDRKDRNVNDLNGDDGESYTESILVVDDEEALRSLAEEILSGKGYKVECAENAQDALNKLQFRSFDLMLSDIIMPEMNGLELAVLVKDKYPLMKIQLVSGFAENSQISKDNDKELYSQLMEKPYSANKLLNKIRDLLDS